MLPMLLDSPEQWLVLLVIVLVLFGGSRLAGLGKASGKALREFKEETQGLSEQKNQAQAPVQPVQQVPMQQVPAQPIQQQMQQMPAQQMPVQPTQQPVDPMQPGQQA